jgi:branched-chain amino acid transport system permease protein
MFELILQFLFGAIRDGSIYALIGLGLAVVHRTTEVMFFAQGALAMVSGVTIHALCTHMNLSPLLALPAGLTVSVVAALASQRLIVLPLINRGATRLSISIVTIGVAFLCEMVVILAFGKDPLPVPPFSGDKPIHISGASILPQDIWIVGTLLLFSTLLVLFFKKTWTGKAMTGIGENPLLARALGFPMQRLFTYSFVFSALSAGAAGAMYAPVAYTGYFVAVPLTIKGFVAAAVGGINNPLGAVIGGMIIGLFESFTAGFVSSGMKDLITIILLLVVLYWRPEGLMGER